MRSRELYKKPVSLRITDNGPVRAMFHSEKDDSDNEASEEDVNHLFGRDRG